MKRLINIFFILAGLTALSSCSSNDEGGGGGGGSEKTYSISITSGSTTTIPADGGTATIVFTASDNWTASCSSSWCTISSTSGKSGSNTITVEVEPNAAYNERNASINLSCGTKLAKATIYQKQVDAILVSSDRIEMDQNGGSAKITVQSNIDYTWEITSGSDWIKEGTATKGMSTSTIYLDIEDNWEETVRQGEVQITGGDITETVTIYQQASTPRIVISQTEYELTSGAQTITIELKTNCDYNLTLPEVDWITEDQTKAASVYTHYINIAENTTYDNRSAEIKVNNLETSEVETITINQSQVNAIVLGQSEYEFEGKCDTLNLKVNTNVAFETSIDVNWITEIDVQTKALEEVPLSFQIATNVSDKSRVGKITFSYGEEIKQVITVTQQGNTNVTIYKITHCEKDFTIPDFGGVSAGTIDWGDGSQSEYSRKASHAYDDESEKVVSIQFVSGNYVYIKKLQSISDIEYLFTSDK